MQQTDLYQQSISCSTHPLTKLHSYLPLPRLVVCNNAKSTILGHTSPLPPAPPKIPAVTRTISRLGLQPPCLTVSPPRLQGERAQPKIKKKSIFGPQINNVLHPPQSSISPAGQPHIKRPSRADKPPPHHHLTKSHLIRRPPYRQSSIPPVQPPCNRTNFCKLRKTKKICKVRPHTCCLLLYCTRIDDMTSRRTEKLYTQTKEGKKRKPYLSFFFFLVLVSCFSLFNYFIFLQYYVLIFLDQKNTVRPLTLPSVSPSKSKPPPFSIPHPASSPSLPLPIPPLLFLSPTLLNILRNK